MTFQAGGTGPSRDKCELTDGFGAQCSFFFRSSLRQLSNRDISQHDLVQRHIKILVLAEIDRSGASQNSGYPHDSWAGELEGFLSREENVACQRSRRSQPAIPPSESMAKSPTERRTHTAQFK